MENIQVMLYGYHMVHVNHGRHSSLPRGFPQGSCYAALLRVAVKAFAQRELDLYCMG